MTEQGSLVPGADGCLSSELKRKSAVEDEPSDDESSFVALSLGSIYTLPQQDLSSAVMPASPQRRVGVLGAPSAARASHPSLVPPSASTPCLAAMTMDHGSASALMTTTSRGSATGAPLGVPAGKGDTISEPPRYGFPEPPFPWSTNRVAVHRSLAKLSKRGIDSIEGEVQCNSCGIRRSISFDIETELKELHHFVSLNILDMDDGHAPPVWTDPILPGCIKCGQKNSLRPVISMEDENINCLFLLLGQMLGLCTLQQLKYFCAHTGQHRTGAKERLLCSTYMELYNQLLFPERKKST